MPPRGLEQIVGADDVAVEDRVPGAFDRKAAEMDDALHTRDGALHLSDRGEVSLDEGFIRREVVRRLDVAPVDLGIDTCEELAQPGADVACCACDQDRLHHVRLPTLRRVTRIAELRRECLIALAAVEQMPAHGGARLRDGTFPDRTHDLAMLLLEYLAVDAPG